jgi:hypothetical protein
MYVLPLSFTRAYADAPWSPSGVTPAIAEDRWIGRWIPLLSHRGMFLRPSHLTPTLPVRLLTRAS